MNTQKRTPTGLKQERKYYITLITAQTTYNNQTKKL